jgi:hypothetical protein
MKLPLSGDARSTCRRAVETRKNHQREFQREPVAEPDRKQNRPQNDGLLYDYWGEASHVGAYRRFAAPRWLGKPNHAEPGGEVSVRVRHWPAVERSVQTCLAAPLVERGEDVQIFLSFLPRARVCLPSTSVSRSQCCAPGHQPSLRKACSFFGSRFVRK